MPIRNMATCKGYLSEIRNEMEADGKSAEYIRHEEKIKDLLYERNNTDPAEELIDNSAVTNMVLLPWSRNRGLCVRRLWARRIRNGLSS